jgi:DUF971 family protein
MEIRFARDERRLLFLPAEGEPQPFDSSKLRRACRCAQCEYIRRTGGELAPPTARVEIEDVQPMGYGIQIAFSDGHRRGIYPWEYLATLAD